MSMTITASKGKSPYAKHGKAPYQPSGYYTAWSNAVERFGLYSDEAFQADVNFRRAFNIPLTPRTYGGY